MDITAHIKSNGLSRGTICEQAGISRAHLSLIENNIRQIGPLKVKDLARALGVTASELRPDLAALFGEA